MNLDLFPRGPGAYENSFTDSRKNHLYSGSLSEWYNEIMKLNTFWHSLGHAVLVVLYVWGVAFFMSHGQQIFGDDKSVWIPVTILLVFVISASITGTLVLGRPILLYMEGKKKEGLKFFGSTLAWLAVIVFIILSVQLWK